MAKHGPEAHYLRPDGVYITSELQPTAGFNPVPDTMAIAARFVAPTGLAGPVGQIHLLGRQRRRVRLLRGDAGAASSLRQRWAMFWGRVRANMMANKFIDDMRIRPALPPGSQVTVDTSPRPPNTDPTALAVQSGWAPDPQTSATAAVATVSYSPASGDPPNMGPVVTAVSMDPAEAAFPANFWQRVIQGGYPPVVAQRAENDALFKWFGKKSPTGAGY